MDGRWPYSCCFVGCCLQFNKTRSILMALPSSFFSIGLVSVHVEHQYGSIDTTAAWKKLHFVLSVRSDFHMIDSLSIAAHAFASHVLMRHCFRGRWTCPLVSEDHPLVWRYRLFDESTCILFCLRCHGGLCHLLLVPGYVARIRLKWVNLPEALCHQRGQHP